MYKIEHIKPSEERKQNRRVPIKDVYCTKRQQAKNWCRNNQKKLWRDEFFVIVHPCGRREAV